MIIIKYIFYKFITYSQKIIHEGNSARRYQISTVQKKWKNSFCNLESRSNPTKIAIKTNDCE
jgi:hypothetical protein